MYKSLIPDDFSDVVVIASSPSTRPKSFIAGVFKTYAKAESYVVDMKRFKVPYDFIIGDYTYRRYKNA